MAGAKVLGGLAADPFISVADYMDAAVSGPARVDDRMSSAPACLFDISQCGLIVHLLPTLSHCGGRVCFFPLELTLFAVISLAPRFHQTDHCPVGFTHDPVRSTLATVAAGGRPADCPSTACACCWAHRRMRSAEIKTVMFSELSVGLTERSFPGKIPQDALQSWRCGLSQTSACCRLPAAVGLFGRRACR
jgi:hypothetical protein